MKKFSQKEALNEIFCNNEIALTPKMLVYKYRHKNGTLSQKSIDEILKDNEFEMIQESIYTKK